MRGFVAAGVTLAAALLSLGAASGNSVYSGKVEGAKRPSEIVAATVFGAIPEYQQIRDRGLTKDDAEYWVLLNKANEKFYRAVRKMVDEKKYDVVAEKGVFKFDPAAADATNDVVSAIEK